MTCDTLHGVFNVIYFIQVCKRLCPRIRDPPKFPEKILFCGWRRDIDDMIMVILLIGYAILWPYLHILTFFDK